MNITTDELLTIIGAKEAELFVLRKRIAELEARAIASSGNVTTFPNPEA